MLASKEFVQICDYRYLKPATHSNVMVVTTLHSFQIHFKFSSLADARKQKCKYRKYPIILHGENKDDKIISKPRFFFWLGFVSRWSFRSGNCSRSLGKWNSKVGKRDSKVGKRDWKVGNRKLQCWECSLLLISVRASTRILCNRWSLNKNRNRSTTSG